MQNTYTLLTKDYQKTFFLHVDGKEFIMRFLSKNMMFTVVDVLSLKLHLTFYDCPTTALEPTTVYL